LHPITALTRSTRMPTYPLSLSFSVRSSKNLAIFYSKLLGGTQISPAGRVAKYSKSAKYTKGKPDLNHFFPSLCDLTLGSGIKSKGAFELDSNRSNTPVNLHFFISSPDHLNTQFLITNIELSNFPSLPDCSIPDYQITDSSIEWFFSQPVGVELESNCSRIAVNVRFPQAIHSPRHLKECLTSSVVQEILRIAQSPRSGS